MPKGNGKSALVDALLGGRADAGAKLTPDEMVQNLQEAGYTITKEDPLHVGERFEIKSRATRRWEGGQTLRFGVVSDTQIGSRKQQLTFLHTAYDRFQEKGIDTVYHCGDVVDGDGRVYPGQQFDLFLYGFDKQLEYTAEHYPRREGVTTYMITGNHDWSFWQRGGADILKSLSERRPDMKYLGPMGAQVTIDGLRVQLLHIKGGLTYARSYKLQKIIEQMAPEQKSDFLFCGDRHSWAHIPQYRNVYGWQMGCFQAQTDHEKRLGLYPELGALIVEVDHSTPGSDKRNAGKGHDGRPGIVAIRHEQLPFFVPIADDWKR